MPITSTLVRFGIFEVDLRSGELRKGGMKIRLADQPLQILVLLLEHPGQVVTREELRQRLWSSDTFVDFEHGVNAAVKRLREALADTADNPRFIETLPRLGYRFIMPVEAAESPVVAPIVETVEPLHKRSQKAWFALVALIFTVASVAAGIWLWHRWHPKTSIHAIAVLPFDNLSGDPGQQYFSDGMTEAVITELGQVRALRVISRQSVMHYKGMTKTIPEIAHELNVDAVVEGSALRDGDKVRISVQLVRAMPEEQLWAESYQRDLRGVLGLQGEIARSIADKVQAVVTPTEHARLMNAGPVNPEAYDDYLKGMQYWYKLTPQDLETALKYFDLALTEQPESARAYAGISMVWIGRQQMGYTIPSEAGPKARAAALKAVALDDNLADAHFALADVRVWSEWDWAGGEAEFRRSIELNPNYPDAHAHFSHLLMNLHRVEEAMMHSERAIELDPLNPFIRAFYGVVLHNARRYDQAITQLRKALEMAPEIPFAHWELSASYFMKGEYEKSLTEVKGYYAGDAELKSALTQGYAQSGYRGAMKLAADRRAARTPRSYELPCDLAMMYAWAGEENQALSWLEKGFAVRDPNMPYMSAEPTLDFVRKTPQFQDLMRRMNLPL